MIHHQEELAVDGIKSTNCWVCKKPGHKARACPDKQKETPKQDSPKEATEIQTGATRSGKSYTVNTPKQQ